MKCPYCGNEMEKGFIQGKDGVFWSEKPHVFTVVNRFSKKAVKLNRYNEDTMLGNTAVAFCCKDCKKVIIDYSEE